jgi:low affinity Fe/Cu permease
MTTPNTWFAKMAQRAAKITGSSPAFFTVCLLTLLWLGSGPLFRWSDTWQLIINTISNIVALLMLFLIQNTQNRESAALQLKADELLRAVQGAQNAFINLEELSEEDLLIIKERYARMAELARAKAGITSPPSPDDWPKGSAPSARET